MDKSIEKCPGVFGTELRRFIDDIQPVRPAIKQAGDAKRPPLFVAKVDPGATADERRIVAFAQLLVLLVFVMRGVDVRRLNIDDRIGRGASSVVDFIKLLDRTAAVVVNAVGALFEPLITFGAFFRYELIERRRAISRLGNNQPWVVPVSLMP